MWYVGVGLMESLPAVLAKEDHPRVSLYGELSGIDVAVTAIRTFSRALSGGQRSETLGCRDSGQSFPNFDVVATFESENLDFF